MKIKSILMAAMFASAGFIAQAAHAETVTKTSTLVLETDGEGGYNSHFGNNFNSTQTGMSFSDKFEFVVDTGFDSSASLTSTFLNSSKVKDLLITGFSLTKYDAVTGALGQSYAGTNETNGSINDTWSLTTLGLSSGSYFLTVNGQVVGNGGGTYGSDLTISVSAVPEPSTYGMLLGGLGLLGFVARRKASKKAA